MLALSLTRDIEAYPSLQELDEKRDPTHSPTGLTPSRKQLKSTRADENVTSRKRLFNSVGDMGDDISNLLSLPVEKGNTTTVKVCFHKISLQTYNQLTEERSRNAQWANAVADTEIDHLEGLEPTFGDWHLKKNLYQVVFQTLLA